MSKNMEMSQDCEGKILERLERKVADFERVEAGEVLV